MVYCLTMKICLQGSVWNNENKQMIFIIVWVEYYVSKINLGRKIASLIEFAKSIYRISVRLMLQNISCFSYIFDDRSEWGANNTKLHIYFGLASFQLTVSCRSICSSLTIGQLSSEPTTYPWHLISAWHNAKPAKLLY